MQLNILQCPGQPMGTQPGLPHAGLRSPGRGRLFWNIPRLPAPGATGPSRAGVGDARLQKAFGLAPPRHWGELIQCLIKYVAG